MTDRNKPLRVALIGCGVIAETHIGYVRKAGAQVVAVADLSVGRVNDFADRYGVQRCYTAVERLLDVERPDIVHVLTPPHTHAEAAEAALERGIHALVEKPLATTMADVERMAAAAKRGNAILCVDHNRLFDPPMLEARRLLEEGALGDLVAVESFQAGEASRRGWLSSLPGGGIGDLVPHPLYLELAFIGRVSDLEAYAVQGPDTEGPTDLHVMMRGERCLGGLTISMSASPGLNTLKLYGTKMSVEVNLNNMTIVRRREYALPKVVAKPMPNLDEARQLVAQTLTTTLNFVSGKVRYYPGMGELIRRFYAAARGEGPAPVSVEQAAEVVRVTSKIWERVDAAHERGPVRAAG